MFVIFACGVFGLIIGSFLNVLILRHDERPIRGRSSCMSCGTTLRWFDLVPVVSWILLRGRCRTCGSRISIQYPLVEAATATTFMLVGYSFFQNGFPAPEVLTVSMLSFYILPSFMIAALLIAIAVYDLYYMIIPDEWVFLFAGIALLSSLFGWSSASASTIILSGPLAAAPLYALWLVSEGRWMGLGDSKLALGIGWLLGPYVGIAAVFLAFIIGAVVSVGILIPFCALRAGHGRITIKSEVPFGPFLIVSTFALWLATLYGAEPSLLSFFS